MTNFQMKFLGYVASICKLKLVPMKRENSRKYFKSNLKVFHFPFGEVMGFWKSTNFPHVIYSLNSQEFFLLFCPISLMHWIFNFPASRNFFKFFSKTEIRTFRCRTLSATKWLFQLNFFRQCNFETLLCIFDYKKKAFLSKNCGTWQLPMAL